MYKIKKFVKKKFPATVNLFKKNRGIIWSCYYKIAHSKRPSFLCPICKYKGAFADYNKNSFVIKYTQCPKCELYERHRLQFLVFEKLSQQFDFSQMSILHIAPELAFKKYLKKRFCIYHTADIVGEGTNFQADIRALPFNDCSYDVIFASHVLEHVKEDYLALSEIRRVLKPQGLAILPVPVVSPITINYPKPNPYEFGHVRAIGLDYFDLYRKFFSDVVIWDSSNFKEDYQLYTYEDRSFYPTNTCPNRIGMPGSKHSDFVPVCFL